MHPALAESFELSVPPEAAIARVKARLCATDAAVGPVTFRAHPRPDRFYLDCWYAVQGVRAPCSVLVTVRPDRDGCVLTLAPVEASPQSDARRALLSLALWLALLPWGGLELGLVWAALGPALVLVLSRAEARGWLGEHQREIVAALSRAVGEVRRGGYRALAPSASRAATDLTLTPREAVSHAASHVGDDERIVFRPHFELGCFRVERRRRPGERGGSTLVEVRAHGDDFGSHLELRPRAPNLWARAGGATFVALGLASLVWGAAVFQLFVPLMLAVFFALKQRQRRLQPQVDRDCLEIEAEVRRAFAPVRRASLEAKKDG
jgi:hypothetical protein